MRDSVRDLRADVDALACRLEGAPDRGALVRGHAEMRPTPSSVNTTPRRWIPAIRSLITIAASITVTIG